MPSPLDAFPPEASESAQVLARVDQPREDSGSWHPIFADIPLPAKVTGEHRAVARLSTLAGGVTGALRTVARPLMVRRERRVALPTEVRGAYVSVIATSALTSAGVSLLTMWLWGQVLAPQQPHTPTLPLPTPVVAVVTKPTPLPAAPQAPAAVPSPAKPRPPVLAPVKHASIARPAAPAPVAALPQTSAGTTADSDHSARATGTSGASGLLVITEPEGARVTINGVGWGTTPVAIPYLPSGSKRVRVTKSGYDSEERLVEPGSAPTGATLRIELRESSAGRLPQ
jgi:PEGA domain